MSADRLREAAKVLRERCDEVLALDANPGDAVANFVAFYGSQDESLGGHLVTDGAYIATMHPGVGLALADTMELEAALLDSMPPFAELISLAIEQKSGIKGFVKMGLKPDGQPHMHAESTPGLLAICDLILGSAS